MKDQSKKFKLNLQLFAEEEHEPTVEDQKIPPVEENTVKAFKELKENTVPKEDYLKVVKQNKELWEAALNGETVKDGDKDKPVSPTVQELREDLYGGKKQLSNLEYCEKTLLLRKALMEQGETDPFVPVGEKIVPEQSDFEAAQRVADVLQECIDYANGDSEVFTNELQRRTVDIALPRRK